MAGGNIVLTMVVGPRVLGESVTRDHYSAAAVIMVRRSPNFPALARKKRLSRANEILLCAG